MKAFLLVIGLSIVLSMPVGAVNLIKSGQAVARIVVSEKATPEESAAATELSVYIQKMAGVQLPIIKTDTVPSGDVVIIGRHPETLRLVGTDLKESKIGFDGVVLKTFKDQLVLVGMNDNGTHYAVVELLKRLGCRFFLPHPDGEVIPSRKDITISKLDIIHKPDFAHRVFWNNGNVAPTLAHPDWYAAWSLHTFQGGINIMHGHNYFGFVPDTMFSTHPEYFPFLKSPDGTMQRVLTGQRCLSNPDVVKLAAESAIFAFDHDKTLRSYSLSPNDGGGWCECEKCKAMDSPDPQVGLATRVLKFNNQVADIVYKKYPEKWLFYYGEYGNIPGPPIGMKAHPMIMAGIVNSYDTVHGLFDKRPTLNWNKKYRQRLDFWGKTSRQQFVYEWYQYSTLPTPFVYAVGERIQYYKKMGVKGYSGEIIGRSPVNDLAMYISSQMLWDASQDPKRLLSEFFRLYFAECARPMEDYYKLLHEITYYSRKSECRASEGDWSADLIKRLHAKLDQAKAMAKQDVVKRRLDREQKSLDVTDYVSTAFRESDKWGKGDKDARTRGSVAANKAVALLKSISNEDIVAEAMIIEAVKILQRAVLDSDVPVPSNSARMQPGWDDDSTFGDIWKDYEEIGKVPAVWKFKIDPEKVGRSDGWSNADYDDTSWENARIAEFWEA